MSLLSAAWVWAKSAPAWVWYGALAALGLYVAKRQIDHMKDEAYEEGREDTIDDIEESTNEAIERVERVERSTADLNREQLRKLAAGSRHNRTSVRDAEPD